MFWFIFFENTTSPVNAFITHAHSADSTIAKALNCEKVIIVIITSAKNFFIKNISTKIFILIDKTLFIGIINHVNARVAE